MNWIAGMGIVSWSGNGRDFPYLVLATGDLLQEVWDTLALRALEAAALEEGHDVLAGAMVDDGALGHQQNIVEEVVRLRLGLEQGGQVGGLHMGHIKVRQA